MVNALIRRIWNHLTQVQLRILECLVHHFLLVLKMHKLLLDLDIVLLSVQEATLLVNVIRPRREILLVLAQLKLLLRVRVTILELLVVVLLILELLQLLELLLLKLILLLG